VASFQDKKIELAQLKFAKGKILGTLVLNPDGTPKLDPQGNPQFKGGSQEFTTGDTTYKRANLKDINNDISRLEKEIKQIETGAVSKKNKFLGSCYV